MAAMEWLLIGGVAKRTGLSTPTLRYYEKIGLLAMPRRRASSGYREYPVEVVEHLHFVQLAQRLGLSLDEIKPLVRLISNRTAPPASLVGQGRQRLALARQRIVELERFCTTLREICE